MIVKDVKVPTDQLQASLAGKDDGGGVVLLRVGRALGGAVIGDGYLTGFTVDLRTAGGPSNVLQETETKS